MAKRNEICKKTPDYDKGAVAFAFAGADTVEVTLDTFPAEIVTKLAVYGLSQKVGDSYAGIKDSAKAQEIATGLLETLTKGEWSVRIPGEPRQTLLVQALARAASKAKGEEVTVEMAQEVLDSMDDDQRKALAKDPAIKQAKLEIQQEKLEKESGESSLDSLFS